MSDPSPTDPPRRDPDGKPPKPRRRRRRRGKPKRNQSEAQATSAASPKTSPHASSRQGSTGKTTKPDKDRPAQPKKQNSARSGQKPDSSAQPSKGRNDGRPAKKRRKPRTKQCVHCYTPCTTIHRVRLDHRKQWVFICDLCWPTRCIDNPHYEFGGTWVSGRIVKPESQLTASGRGGK